MGARRSLCLLGGWIWGGEVWMVILRLGRLWARAIGIHRHGIDSTAYIV